ncbi:hypothetical protein GCM10009735_16820 [Actinomadura chokoriensis]
MGAGNAKAAMHMWRNLSHASMRAFVHMALVSLDDDLPPVYFAGREALAMALGRTIPPEDDDPAVIRERRAAFRVVDRALKDLTDAGAIELVRASAPGGRNARYALNLTGPRTTVTVDRSDHGHRGPKRDRARANGPRSASSTNHGQRHERTTVSVTTDHGKRGPEEKEEDGGLRTGVVGSSGHGPSGSAHARASEDDRRRRDQSQPTCEHCRTVLDPDGSCFVCASARHRPVEVP